jgi:hypothetical protein
LRTRIKKLFPLVVDITSGTEPSTSPVRVGYLGDLEGRERFS